MGKIRHLDPAEFLPAMIDSGLIKPVTQWILIEAGKQCLTYKAAGQPAVPAEQLLEMLSQDRRMLG